MKTYRCYLLVGAALIGTTPASKLPPIFQRCKVQDQNFNECLKGAVEDALSKMTRTYQDLGLVCLDPLVIPSLTVGAGVTGAVAVAQELTDIKVYGYSTIKLESLDVDFTNKTIVFKTKPFLFRLTSRYHLNGKVLVLPIQGDGDFILRLENLRMNLAIKWEEYQKKGQIHMRATEGHMALQPKRVVFNFQNLFNGDKIMGDNINNLLNDNWQDVYNDIKVQYQEAFSAVLVGVADGLFAKVPKSEIFEGA